MKELWKDVEGYDGDYLVSNLGNVKSFKNKNPKKILKPGKNRGGYYFVILCKNSITKSFTIHRLVSTAFLPNPENKPEVNHKNGLKTDNNVTNLEWVTCKENIQHAWQTGVCENVRKSCKKNVIKAHEVSKKPIYSKKLNLKFESILEAATYLQTYYFEGIKLTTIQTYISLLLNNKTTKLKFDYGWEYI